ncbi:uncharacterized protein LOC144578937 [Callithrix jacchus]
MQSAKRVAWSRNTSNSLWLSRLLPAGALQSRAACVLTRSAVTSRSCSGSRGRLLCSLGPAPKIPVPRFAYFGIQWKRKEERNPQPLKEPHRLISPQEGLQIKELEVLILFDWGLRRERQRQWKRLGSLSFQGHRGGGVQPLPSGGDGPLPPGGDGPLP